jgi:DNA excision repair protein ERCC-2
VVDSRCRDLTSAFACEKGRTNPGSVPLCSYHEVSIQTLTNPRAPSDRQELNNYETGNLIPPGVYTLDDVKKYGQEKGVCPYFTIRRMVSQVAVRQSGAGA